MASTKVRVSISCRGNPTISSVGFDNGTYRDASPTIEFPETRVRYMKRNDAAGDVPNHFLGYKLFASANPDLASANMADGEELGTSSSSSFDNKLSLSEGFDGTFFLTGKVFESSALRSAGMFSQIGSVPGGQLQRHRRHDRKLQLVPCSQGGAQMPPPTLNQNSSRTGRHADPPYRTSSCLPPSRDGTVCRHGARKSIRCHTDRRSLHGPLTQWQPDIAISGTRN